MEFTVFFLKHNLINRKKLFLRFLIVASCFALVVVTLIFSRSMIRGMQDKMVYLFSGHLSVNASRENVEHVLMENYADYEKKASSVIMDNVVTGYMMMYTKDGNSAFTIKGVEDDYLEKRRKYIRFTISEEDMKNKIVISERSAEKLGLSVGDRVAVMVANSGGSSAVRPDIATVCGLYSSGFAEIDDNLVFATYEYGAALFPSEDSRKTEILLKKYSYRDLESLDDALYPHFETRTFMQANAFVFRTLTSSNQAIILILFLIIVVSAYSTMSATEEIFFEEKKTLEVYKMLGANRIMLRNALLVLVLGAVSAACLAAFMVGAPFAFMLPKIIKGLGLMAGAEGMYLLDFKSVIPVGLIFVLFVVQILISAVFVFLGIRKDFQNDALALF